MGRRGGEIWFPLILIVLGGIFLLKNLGVVSVSLHRWWPVIFILWGASILLRRSTRNNT